MNAVSHSLFILLSFSSYFQSSVHLFNPSQHTCNTWPGCVWGSHSICTWDSLWRQYVLYHSHLVCGFSGRLCGKRRWISDFFAAQAGWHQGQQAGHESAPFCCYGKSWNVGVKGESEIRDSPYLQNPEMWLCFCNPNTDEFLHFFLMGNKQLKSGISHFIHNQIMRLKNCKHFEELASLLFEQLFF